MGFWSRILGNEPVAMRSSETRIVHAQSGQVFNGLNDPALLEFIRTGSSSESILRTTCVLRCVDVLSASRAMLPTRLIDRQTKKEAIDHPLYELLRWQPNRQQTAYEFYQLMDVRRLLHGDAFAAVIRGVGKRPVALQPLDPTAVTVKQLSDWSLKYTVARPDGQTVDWPAEDMLHVRDLSVDGIRGAGRAKLAAEAIKVSRAAEQAQGNIFANGMMAGGALEHPNKLSEEAHKRLTTSMEEKYAGPDNAGRWMILEEGMKASRFTLTGDEAQTIEARNHQIEEVARAFGVPRPFLMMDDTSWGTGIEQLAIMFVRFGLNPGMVAWEQALRRVLLTPGDRAKYTIDIDEHELLRGTMKDQAEFFTKALGGHPWMTQDEVRDEAGFASIVGGDKLKEPVGGKGIQEKPQ